MYLSRVCKVCGVEKVLGLFRMDNGRPGYHCKSCTKLAKKPTERELLTKRVPPLSKNVWDKPKWRKPNS